MVDFEFYLNRQGPQGVKGPKGDTGFSPVITVNTSTSTEYTLDIQNETYSFTTPNLRPELTESEGTYVRVDGDGNWYLGEVDTADEQRAGIVRLASAEDIQAGLEDPTQMSDSIAISPSVLSETLTDFIVAGKNITKTVDDTGVITINSTTPDNIYAYSYTTQSDRTTKTGSIPVGDAPTLYIAQGTIALLKEIESLELSDMNINITNQTDGDIVFNKTPKVGSNLLISTAMLDGQTIQVDSSNIVHVNMDEIGEEMAGISARVTALEDSLSGIETIIDEILGTSTESINTLVTDINGEEVS